ncbi:SDR family NAD(P)-dependent oxidoreductase [Vibrio jasicida]|uniref:SDR family NAD(P)-dependent oxidoreductase n=1 Tax=Vibrio jasicida TaxID=766224 RepID=UPI0011AFB347|nr:SDR family oxidoreductase [Vibrio jasicida]
MSKYSIVSELLFIWAQQVQTSTGLEELHMLLSNKIAIITGAASGIGLETVKLFLEEGAKVVAGDISPSEGILEISRSNPNCNFQLSDVTEPNAHSLLIETAVEEFGGLDICFNNAGIIGDTSTPAAEQDMTIADKVYEVNVRGVALAMNAQVAHFLSINHSNPVIINTASIAGKIAVRNSAPYVTSKHAVVGLTKAYAVDYAEKIRINMVAPGVIATSMIEKDADQERARKTIESHPVGRVGQPREISELVAFLASDRATFINGAYFNADGGYLAV